MSLPKILNYSSEKLVEKKSFQEHEKGIVGFFHKNHYNRFNVKENDELIIIAPNQKEFDNSSFEGQVPNHRFLNYLAKEFDLHLQPKKKFSGIGFSEEISFVGGEFGKYELRGNLLIINPSFKDDPVGSESDEEYSRNLKEVLEKSGNFKGLTYLITKPMHRIPI